MKKLIQILLLIAVVALGYILTMQILDPLNFVKERAAREAVVIERVKDIRTAQRAFKSVHQNYSSNFEELISFLENDSLVYDKVVGSFDDSLAVAKGLVRVEKFNVAVKDTIFGARKYTAEALKAIDEIPYGNGAKFIMDATSLVTESQVIVPVFECKAPYKTFLTGIDDQELINLIDDCINVLNKYPGIKVGSLEQATNDAGNWE
ncbi:MAG: hypothetical protein R3Y38_07300 [Rikenellaceae bacterium]